MRREFEILTKPSSAPIAVKRGFSWPAFFFSWIWAFSRGLWLEGILISLVGIMIGLAEITLLAPYPILSILAALAVSFYVGIKGNYWRSRRFEHGGFNYQGLISARSGKFALAAFARGERTEVAASTGLFSYPKSFQRIFAIAGLTWKAAFRFRLFIVLAGLLLAAVVGLPLVIKDDGTARGFTQILLTYTLSAITALLGFSTLWLACGTLARDIEECQIQVLATKPVARWQIWLGKWLGILSLNAVLLALSGACVFGLLQWRATKLPPNEQKNLREQILVARGSAKPQNVAAKIDAAAESKLREQLKAKPELAKSPDLPEVKRQIVEQIKAEYQLVPPDYIRVWQIDLGPEKESLLGKPLQLRIKFNASASQPGMSGTLTGLWLVGDPQKRPAEIEQTSLSPDTFHEFPIPADLLDDKGMLTIAFRNVNANAVMLFPIEDGIEVLYPQGGFAMNFARGLGIIFCWMALLAALGLAAASFLSFPVAAFFSLSMLVVVLSSGTLAEAVGTGSVAAGNEETGESGHSGADIVLIPAFKAMLAVVNLVKDFSPVDSLSTGRAITWGELGLAFAQIVLLPGGIISLIGIALFNRRELATAQGTQ